MPLGLVGFVSLAGQGLLFREHLRLYGGDELGVGFFLAAWLLWIAVGSRLHRALPARPGAFLAVITLQPLTVVLAACLLWRARAWAGLGPTDAFPPTRLLPLTLLAVAPVSLATGWLIPAGARWLAAGGGPEDAVGRAWAAEALGGALGGAAVTLVLVLGTTPLALLEGPRQAALPMPEGAAVLETLDTPYTSWTAARLGGGVAIYGDGALRTHLSEDGGEVWTAAALLAQRPGARRAGILGVGAEALACRLLDAGMEQVTVVVRDPAWPSLLRRHATGGLATCLEDPRLTWRHGDRPPPDAGWDLAWLQHTDPTTAAAARFLSRDSLARIRGGLSADGVLGLSITVTENVLEGPALAYARAVDATIAAVFSRVVATGGERMLLLGSDGPLSSDADALADRLDRGPGPRLGVPGAGLSVAFEAPRMAARRAQLDAAPGGPILAHRPTTPLLHLLQEGEASGDPLVGILVARGGLIPWLVLALALAVLGVLGGRVRRGEDGVATPVALVAFGGAAAMAWQLILLLAWQVHFGSLAAHFGILSGVFMLGLWAGATTMNLRLRGRAASPRTLAASAGALLAVGAGLLGILLSSDASTLLGAALVVTAAALGAAAGTVVPTAAALLGAAGEGPDRAATRLSVADHLGAVAATLIAGLVLVPLVGFSLTVLLGMAGVAAAGGLALLSSRAAAPGGIPGRRVVWRGRARIALLLAATVSLHQAAATPDGPDPDAAQDPGGLSTWDAVSTPFPHRVRWGADGGIRRIRITDGAPRFPGYEGPVSLVLDLDPDGVIIDAKMGPHRETPAYVWGIEDWVEDLRGHGAGSLHLRGEGPVGADEVDAMTGATVTCRGLLASARASATAADAARAAPPRGPAPPVPDDIKEPLEAPPQAAEEGPRLHRKDTKQTPHQRDVDRKQLEQRLREGTLSDREAEHYLPVTPR
ncbi:MAG: FMN-binding protein [Pseudomonadota bacterium]